MPKGDKKKKNNHNGSKEPELILGGDDQVYGIVKKSLGNRRFTVMCQDGRERLCHLRGSMTKRHFVRDNDVVLVSLRDFQDGKADIINLYTPDQVRFLRKERHLTITGEGKGIENENDDKKDDDDIPFDFDSI
jgi:translation initiation factor 1A